MSDKSGTQCKDDSSLLKPRRVLFRTVSINLSSHRFSSSLSRRDIYFAKIPNNTEYRASYVTYSNVIRNDTYKLDSEDYRSFRSLKKHM